MLIEIIGTFAAVIVAASMCFKTSTRKGTILLRSVNILGSLLFLVYGLLLPAYSTALLNVAAIVINIYRLTKDSRKQKNIQNPRGSS